jgi:hypothetical protein
MSPGGTISCARSVTNGSALSVVSTLRTGETQLTEGKSSPSHLSTPTGTLPSQEGPHRIPDVLSIGTSKFLTCPSFSVPATILKCRSKEWKHRSKFPSYDDVKDELFEKIGEDLTGEDSE